MVQIDIKSSIFFYYAYPELKISEPWITLFFKKHKYNVDEIRILFWISKEGHEFLMEEDAFNGMFRYKVKMPGYSPDIIKRFM